MIHLDQLAGRILVRGRLVLQTALHIGAGKGSFDPVAPDQAVVRDGSGNPYIPGSSLKGALRAYMERLLWVGWLRGPDAARCYHAGSNQQWEEFVRQAREEVARTKGDRDDPNRLLADRIGKVLCPVCRLFGAPHYAGRLLIRDMPPVPGEGPGHWESRGGRRVWVVHVQERSSVGIDRDTHTARPTILYDFETVPPGVAFALSWLVENPDENDRYNLLLALLALRRGEVPLGGKSTRGLGHVELQDAQVLDLSRPGLLRRYVLGDDLKNEWQPVETLASIDIPAAPRVRREAVMQALAAAGEELSWADIVRHLSPLFGGEAHV